MYICDYNHVDMINRTLYINQIEAFIDKPFVKIISGLRRSGKSCILLLLKKELMLRGASEKQILYMNFESFEFSHITESKEFYEYIQKNIDPSKRFYLLIDEIQEVKQWEKAINSLIVNFNVDIYITGSNSRLLSSELSTYLTGRYVEIHVLPLSFNEFLYFNEQRNKTFESKPVAFETYMKMGGFPALHITDYTFETAYKIAFDIYSSAILRDTVQRHNIRDVELLERVVKYVFDNIGSSFSAKRVADYFKSQQRKIDLNTVYNYLNALESAFIIYRIPRYDVKGREILKTQEKYFVGDLAMLYAAMGYRDRMISGILENIIMLEMKRRGYRVYVGKAGTNEIDFVAELNDSKIYVQVTYNLSDASTIDREVRPLNDVKDFYPKYILSMDSLFGDNINGIKHMHISKFLLLDNWT